MTDAEFIEYTLDRVLELASQGADREAQRQNRKYCPSCWSGPLARILVLEIFPRIKDGSVSREMVEAAGAQAVRESFAIHEGGKSVYDK